jgi:Na+/H+ antiporter NhaD/arsenite permease-like protein
MMLVSSYLYLALFLNGPRISSCGFSCIPQRLLFYLILTSGILSALLVNDTICLMLTPLVIAVIRRGKLPLLPYLIALATSANIGSVATLVGNPQNMIIGHFSHIPFSEFSRTLAPAAIIGLAINFMILRFGFRVALRSAVIERKAHIVPETQSRFICDRVHRVLVDLCLLCRWVESGMDGALGRGAGDGARASRHAGSAQADRLAPAFFAALFVVVDGLSDTGLPDAIYRHLRPVFGSSVTTQTWNLA